jgi:hypothetical protein
MIPEVVLVVVEKAVDGDVTVGIVGTNGAVPTVGDTPSVGTAAAELTPRLPISVDPIGIPVRAPPPGVVGDVDVGVDEEAILLEPEPHIPDIPEVSSIPDVADIADDDDIPDDIDVPAVPDIAAVAGDVVPVPPPSKVAVDPNIVEDEVPKVEHVVPLLGIAMVPVTPVGAGLTPGDAISVEPIGIPAAPTGALGPIPSGEVAPSEGVAVTAPAWANAGLHSKGHAIATIKKRFMEDSPGMSWSIYAARRSGGAMNSGPIGSLIVSCRIWSISAIAELSMCQPATSAIGAS